MPVTTTFFALTPACGGLVALGPGFQAQFVSVGTNTVSTSLNVLYRAALNAGYGGTRSASTGLTVSEWRALRRYLRTRLDLMVSMLVNTPVAIMKNPAVDHLERTEVRALSYLLGSIFCRVATDAWAEQVPVSIDRFWHWSVVCDKACCAARPGLERDQNPDYLVQVNGAWHTVEAKGTFGSLHWDALQRGLRQAMKWNAIGIVGATTPASSNVAITDFVCTMASFDATDILHLTHLDPPPSFVKELDQVGPPAPRGPVFVPAFAELVGFERAFMQFESLGQAIQEPQPPIDFPSAEWRLLHDANTPGGQVYLCLSKRLSAYRPVLALSLRALRIVMPMVVRHGRFGPGEVRTKQVADADRASLQAQLIAAAETSPAHEEFWRGLAAVAGERHWDTLLAAIAAWRLPDTDAAIGELADVMHRDVAIIDRYARRAGIVDDSNAILKISASSYGLLIVSGTWDGSPAGHAERRVKL